jgi:predicted PilT family ATPase
MRYSSGRKTGKPTKSKDELSERIDAKLRELRLHAGNEEFDPVVLMAIIGAEAYDKGDTIVALAAMKEVAQYVRPKLSSVNFEGKLEVETVDSRIKTIEMARRLGAPVDAMIEQFAKDRGLTIAQAWEAVDNVAIPALTRD